jgi:hypothetical protein
MRPPPRLVVLLLVLVMPGRAALGQWPPDSIVNLQVLPKDTPLPELVTTMRGFAGALGVRCIHCHVGDNPNDLASTDFASDERIQKRKAREMIRMVQTINRDLLSRVPERASPPVEVTCTTCHHGVTEPRDIRDVLTAAALAEGAESAIAEYRRLRERYYGSASYDFRPFMLANVAQALLGSAPEAAIRLTEFNLDLHPKDQQSYVTLAAAHLRGADTASAIRVMTRAVEQIPNDPSLERLLAGLRPR